MVKKEITQEGEVMTYKYLADPKGCLKIECFYLLLIFKLYQNSQKTFYGYVPFSNFVYVYENGTKITDIELFL